MKKVWNNALGNEGLIAVVGTRMMPVALSDHSIQMGEKSAKQFLERLLASNNSFHVVKHPRTTPGLRLVLYLKRRLAQIQRLSEF